MGSEQEVNDQMMYHPRRGFRSKLRLGPLIENEIFEHITLVGAIGDQNVLQDNFLPYLRVRDFIKASAFCGSTQSMPKVNCPVVTNPAECSRRKVIGD